MQRKGRKKRRKRGKYGREEEKAGEKKGRKGIKSKMIKGVGKYRGNRKGLGLIKAFFFI